MDGIRGKDLLGHLSDSEQATLIRMAVEDGTPGGMRMILVLAIRTDESLKITTHTGTGSLRV